MYPATYFTPVLCTLMLLVTYDKAPASEQTPQPSVVGENTAGAYTVAEKAVNKKTAVAQVSVGKKSHEGFQSIDWVELMPKDDLDALLHPPAYIEEVQDGSPEDQLSNSMSNAIAAASDDRYQQALVSTRVIDALDGQAIRLPGFIVPLEFKDDQTVTQFFMVPYFGACIHMPPPPPNQIIFVEYPQGLKLDSLYEPFWISGVLKTTTIENDMATAAYSMQMQEYEKYTD